MASIHVRITGRGKSRKAHSILSVDRFSPASLLARTDLELVRYDYLHARRGGVSATSTHKVRGSVEALLSAKVFLEPYIAPLYIDDTVVVGVVVDKFGVVLIFLVETLSFCVQLVLMTALQ